MTPIEAEYIRAEAAYKERVEFDRMIQETVKQAYVKKYGKYDPYFEENNYKIARAEYLKEKNGGSIGWLRNTLNNNVKY